MGGLLRHRMCADEGNTMKQYVRLAVMLALLTPCTVVAGKPSVPAIDSSEKTAVLAALDHYVQAISTNDLQAIQKMQTPEGMTYRARATETGDMEIMSHPNAYWIDPARNDGHTRRFRYWSPTVMVRGGIAAVWVSYEFWIDGKTRHCGVEVFDFLKFNGDWRVSNSMWTVEPDACRELRPADPSQLRPVDR
jgi:hypothetical protein